MLFTSMMLLFFIEAYAQHKPIVHNYSVIKIKDWIIPRTDTLDYALDKTLIMKRKIANYKSASVAYPKDLKFRDGIIEMDVSWPGKANGFVGLAFRIKDAHHYRKQFPLGAGEATGTQSMPYNTCLKRNRILTGGIMKVINTRQKQHCHCMGGFM